MEGGNSVLKTSLTDMEREEKREGEGSVRECNADALNGDDKGMKNIRWRR